MSSLPPTYKFVPPKEIIDMETGEARAPSDLEKKMIENLLSHLFETLKPSIEKANLDMARRRAVSLKKFMDRFLRSHS